MVVKMEKDMDGKKVYENKYKNVSVEIPLRDNLVSCGCSLQTVYGDEDSIGEGRTKELLFILKDLGNDFYRMPDDGIELLADILNNPPKDYSKLRLKFIFLGA